MIWGPLIAFMLSQQPGMRCSVRVSAHGVAVDGDAVTADEAVATCRQRAAALVTVTDDAPATVWPELQVRFERARIKILMRGEINDRDCLDNPLAKGCD